MNKIITYTLGLSAALLMAGGQSFASNVGDGTEGMRTIKVHLLNEIPGVDLSGQNSSHPRTLIKINGDLPKSAPYILPYGEPSSMLLTYDIQVMLTVCDKAGYSQSLLNNLPSTDTFMRCDFKVPNSITLDRIVLTLTATGAHTLSIEDGKVIPGGNTDYVVLGSCWHTLDMNNRGWWLNTDDSLYAHFTDKTRLANMYRVYFGNKLHLFGK